MVSVTHPTPQAEALDKLREAVLARFTGGVSPESLALAGFDWALHLAGAPGKRLALLRALGQPWPGSERLAADPRFAATAWRGLPYRQQAQAFLALQDWWQAATHAVPGTAQHSEDVVAFVARQCLDLIAPSNWPWSNPEVIERSVEQQGMNLLAGALQAGQDLRRRALGLPPDGTERFVVGRDVAATPGQVVLRNRLIELIQYSPTTPRVHAEPILIVPAWIMKYYILDLSAHNSLVRWLVDRGHTVFCISWRNVGARERELGMEDYRKLGVMAALDKIRRIVPRQRVHAAGYCLGGTLLAIAAAAMAGRGDERLASMTLFAAQTDFTEPGEMALFIDPAQLHMLDSMMWRRGFLTADQMAGAFQMLQSNDLIWSRAVREYLMGEHAPMNDLMAWNADATRMPYRMHSEYLHRLFLGNDLAAARYVVDGRAVSLNNLHLPIFLVGTENDHVAPWRSVYKLHHLTDADLTFVLASGGHNAGIVSEPGHPHRHYRIRTRKRCEVSLDAENWQDRTSVEQGSWWPQWDDWLVSHGCGRRVPPRQAGPGPRALGRAPGKYVLGLDAELSAHR